MQITRNAQTGDTGKENYCMEKKRKKKEPEYTRRKHFFKIISCLLSCACFSIQTKKKNKCT